MVLLTCAALLSTLVAGALLFYSLVYLRGLFERSLSAAKELRTRILPSFSSLSSALRGDGDSGDQRKVTCQSYTFIGVMTALLLISWGVFLFVVIASQVRELEDGIPCV